MIKVCKLISTIFLFFIQLDLYSQNSNTDPGTQIIKVVPASPTAASLGFYGSTPISYYTGTPSISIPLYEILSGSLKLPVTLSHHGGGIKVEEMASWVGLGWSLSAGGVITRTVRGIPDDVVNGFFNEPMKVKFMIDHGSDPIYHDQIAEYLKMAGQGTYDTEPDIYYFNFGGISGKFYYDQENNEFYTIPRLNIKISHTNTGDFILTAEGGNVYSFTAKEFTSSTGSNCSPQATAPPGNVYSNSITSWYLTKIENPEATDNITFNYVDKYYSYQTTNFSTGYILTSSIGSTSPLVGNQIPTMETQTCYQWPTIAAKKLSFIHFKNGYLKFNAQTSRCDLINDEELDNVELYNDQNLLQKRFRFQYGYFGDIDQPYNCGDEIASNSRRLKLKSITEENDANGILLQKKPHEFEYFGSLIPNRLSFAQDHWGYYNGANNNINLIPSTIYVPPSGIPMWWSGADRKVNPSYNQIGALTKITYPTGGTTAFTYESNEVKDSTMDPSVIWNTKSIEGDHNGGIQTYYESTPFIINEPPNILNGYNPNGGTFISESFQEIGGCGYGIPGAPATSCAILNLQAVNGGAQSWGPFTNNFENHYVPNGTYKLTASFQQYPAGYADFYFQVKWPSIDPATVNSQLVGGLRIKTVTDFDGINHSNDVIKNFSYINEFDSISSGKLNGTRLNYINTYEQKIHSGELAPWGDCIYFELIRTFLKRSSYSNYPLLTSSGSYVGYSNVSVTYGNSETQNGKTNYAFENSSQDLFWEFPFASLSYDWRRGFLNKEKQYKKESLNFSLVKKNENTYSLAANGSVNPHRAITGLKIGFNRDCLVLCAQGCCAPGTVLAEQNEYKKPIVQEYETNTDYVRHSSSINTDYDQIDTNKTLTTTNLYEYNDVNYMPSTITTKNSNLEDIIVKTKYPIDYAAPWGSSILNLTQKNITTVPIERYTIKKLTNGQQFVIAGSLFKYKTDQPLLDKVYNLEINEPIPINSFIPSYFNGGSMIYDSHYKEKVSFNTYDQYYNIQEQQLTNNQQQSYIWDYKSSYPVAQCNAPLSDIAFTSFEADGTGGFIITGSVQYDINAPTGNNVLNLSFITRAVDNTKSYTISLWSNSSALLVNNQLPIRTGLTRNGYTNYEYNITNASNLNITGSGKIDELRLYPVGSQMVTFTYDPLIGITSQSDANGHTVYYKYDNLGRLFLIRDENQKIVKQYDYQYQASIPNTTPNWQPTGATQCKPCPLNASYFTNIIQIQERDINPESGSYYQYRWTDNGISTSCVSNADWQFTTPPSIRCKVNMYNQNTGEQEQLKMDMNPCSSTAGQTMWVVTGVNLTVCPIPVICNSSNCSGIDKKCINNICETGTKVYTSSVYIRLAGYWRCTYHYHWSDGSNSQDYTETSMNSCL